MTDVSIQKRMIRSATDYPLIGEVVTHKGVKTIRLRDTGICYRDTQGRAFNKKTGKRPGDTPTGPFLRMDTVRVIK